MGVLNLTPDSFSDGGKFNRKNNPNINQTKTFEALKLLDNATIKTCESRYSELEYQERIDITYPEYIDNILNKGSALFECALSLGAVISNNSHSLENTIQELARNISLSIKMKKDSDKGLKPAQNAWTGDTHGHEYLFKNEKFCQCVYDMIHSP